jgi:hypothetical protein
MRWSNPHVVFLIATDPQPGEPSAVWTVEGSSPGNMTRLGWSRQVLKPDDRVAVDIHPLRDGGHGGAVMKVTFLDTGRVLAGGAVAAITAGEKPNLK